MPNKSNKGIIISLVICMFTLIFILPITTAGTIVTHPLSFTAELIFGEGDTKIVDEETIKELYSQFLSSDIGNETVQYINDKVNNDETETFFENVWYIFPIILSVKNADETSTFESLNIGSMIDKAYNLRKQYERDEDYISALKRDNIFSSLKQLSDTTLLTYIGYLKTSDITDVEVTGDSELGKAIAKSALSKRGCKYVWGTQGPNTFDCSGLVWWACKENNVNFGRTTAHELSKMGKGITRKDLQAGDIITFVTGSDKSHVTHVGIYIGDGKMVHAPNSKSVVRVNEVFNSSYYSKVIYNYRRLY